MHENNHSPRVPFGGRFLANHSSSLSSVKAIVLTAAYVVQKAAVH